jgi:Domain of unknown function (DUF4136)
VRRRRALAVILLVVSPAWIAADDLSIQVAPRTDFSVFRTFAMRKADIKSPRPELDNPLFAKILSKTIRVALVARGLKETTGGADLSVDYVVTSDDISTSVPTRARGIGPRPLRYTQGMLVIDLVRSGEADPVWRGVYRDEEGAGSKLVQKLPEGAKKLVGRYPRRRH